jgi:hypothetical protein
MTFWKRILVASLTMGALSGATFWITGVIGLGLVIPVRNLAVYRANWATFWGSAAFCTISAMMAALAAWRYFRKAPSP